MKKETYALLVIDMQLVAFDGKITPPISHGSLLLDKVSTLIEACRSTNTPVMFAQTCAPSGAPYAKDTHGWEIHPKITPRSDEPIVHKVGPSSFENPEFEQILNHLQTTELIVCGTWTEGCVSITCRGALKRGYRVLLAADGHSTVRDTEQEALSIIAEQNELLVERGASISKIDDISRMLGNF
ncbi:MAG: isochorismatase family protein [Pseudomonadales bacterium]|nr:isochorismatase family protein [Pseudomonadales bacterium]